MKSKARGFLVFTFLVIACVVVVGCFPFSDEDLDETRNYVKTAATVLAKTAEAAIKTAIAGEQTSVFGEIMTRVAQTPDEESPFGDLLTEAAQLRIPFKIPASGFMGVEYKELYEYQGTTREHTGIDIWPSKKADNGGLKGNPVRAVMGGKLGRTGSGVEICHPRINKLLYPNLPEYLVCTYYGHLIDLPKEFANLPKDSCPDDLVDVSTGDLLGYMDNTLTAGNGYIVHLHFSVARQNPANGCWTNEMDITNTYDPLIYLGLESKEYDWLAIFP